MKKKSKFRFKRKQHGFEVDWSIQKILTDINEILLETLQIIAGRWGYCLNRYLVT